MGAIDPNTKFRANPDLQPAQEVTAQQIADTGGGGSSLTLQDTYGHTVANAGTIIAEAGLTVGGTSPTATLTPTGGATGTMTLFGTVANVGTVVAGSGITIIEDGAGIALISASGGGSSYITPNSGSPIVGNPANGTYGVALKGSSNSAGAGGGAGVYGGASNGAPGGDVQIAGGYGTGGAGGDVILTAGGNTGTDGGGYAGLRGGYSTDGPGGTVAITAGASNTGAAGNTIINRQTAGTGGQIMMVNLPTADPHVLNALWNSSGIIHISAG